MALSTDPHAENGTEFSPLVGISCAAQLVSRLLYQLMNDGPVIVEMFWNRPLALVMPVTSHPLMSPVNAEALNMLLTSVRDDVSHSEMSPLNAVSANMPPIVVTDPVSQPETSPVKPDPLNIPLMSVTALTSHALTSLLNAAAPLKVSPRFVTPVRSGASAVERVRFSAPLNAPPALPKPSEPQSPMLVSLSLSPAPLKLQPLITPVIAMFCVPRSAYTCVASGSAALVTVPDVPSPHWTTKLYVPSSTSGSVTDVEFDEPLEVFSVSHVLMNASPVGATGAEGSEIALSPTQFVAMAMNWYSVPLVRPDTMHDCVGIEN